MGFFDSLHEIGKNRKHFSDWEKQQEEKQAKREVLYSQRSYTDKEIEKAKQSGKAIMNAIDVMDNHSENVAENVETAFQPVVFATPFLATIGTGWLSGKYVIDPARKRALEETNKILETEEAKKLIQQLQENEHIYKSKDKIFSKKIIKRIKDPELKRSAQEYLDKITAATKKHKFTRNVGIGIIPVALVLSHFFINIFAAKVQVNSSKVARFQARQALKDPKEFVEYTPEQIAQAQQEIDANPHLRKQKRKEDKKLRSGMIGSIASIIKDNKAYRNDKKAQQLDSKMVTSPLTDEEIQQAKRDQEVIQRTVRLINNEAEKYSENMEVAANVIMGGTPFLGMAVGGLTAWILNKTNVIKKFVDKNVKKDASEATLKLYDELLETQKTKTNSITRKLGVITKWSQFYESLRNDISNKLKPTATEGKASARSLIPVKKEIKTLFTSLMAHNKLGGWVIAGIGGIITGVAGDLIALKLQKSSARAGRYTAKRELEKDPKNFIGYTQEDYDEIHDVTPKKKQSKFKEYALFIPTVLKQYHAYNKYRKHEFKENQLLNAQLKKQEVSEEQLVNAKNLQRKIFNTFEKVDDNSQRYSEDTEAAIEIAQPYVKFGGIALAISPLVIFAIRAAKGKISPAKIVEKITRIFGKSSKLANSKLSKKYLNGVKENIDYTVRNTNVDVKPLGTILKDVDLYEGKITANIKNVLINIKSLPEELEKYESHDIYRFWYDMKKTLITLKVAENSPIMQQIEKISRMNKEDQINFVREIINKTDIKNIGDVLAQLKTDGSELLSSASQLFDKMEHLLNSENIDKLKEAIPEEQIKEYITQIKQILQKSGIKEDSKIMQMFGGLDNLTSDQLINKLKELLSKRKEFNIEELLNGNFEKLKESKLVQTINNISVKDIAGKVKSITEWATSYALVQKYKPKAIIQNLKTKIENMSKEEFETFMRKNLRSVNLGGLDKETAKKILDNVGKMIDNIPKEEFEKIFGQCFKSFNEHPDEFIKLVKSGQIMSLFKTPAVENALVIAGVSWAAFSIVMTYIIESWLADIQLKAGRLGVMKSLEELEDPRYYANIEKVQQ